MVVTGEYVEEKCPENMWRKNAQKICGGKMPRKYVEEKCPENMWNINKYISL